MFTSLLLLSLFLWRHRAKLAKTVKRWSSADDPR